MQVKYQYKTIYFNEKRINTNEVVARVDSQECENITIQAKNIENR